MTKKECEKLRHGQKVICIDGKQDSYNGNPLVEGQIYEIDKSNEGEWAWYEGHGVFLLNVPGQNGYVYRRERFKVIKCKQLVTRKTIKI